MTRIAELKQRDEVPPAGRQAFDEIVASRGAIHGPFGVLLHSPELARRAGSLGGYLRYESSLEPRVRETTIMATAAMLDCEYEWAAHEPLARAAGVPSDVLEALRSRTPDQLPAAERDIYDLAEAILVKHRVPADLFERLQQRLSQKQLVEMVAAVGYWTFVAATLNTFEVRPAAN